jgi:hypothetical protein
MSLSIDTLIHELRTEMRWAGSDGTIPVAVPVLEYLLHHLETTRKDRDAVATVVRQWERRVEMMGEEQ